MEREKVKETEGIKETEKNNVFTLWWTSEAAA